MLSGTLPAARRAGRIMSSRGWHASCMSAGGALCYMARFLAPVVRRAVRANSVPKTRNARTIFSKGKVAGAAIGRHIAFYCVSPCRNFLRLQSRRARRALGRDAPQPQAPRGFVWPCGINFPQLPQTAEFYVYKLLILLARRAARFSTAFVARGLPQLPWPFVALWQSTWAKSVPTMRPAPARHYVTRKNLRVMCDNGLCRRPRFAMVRVSLIGGLIAWIQ